MDSGYFLEICKLEKVTKKENPELWQHKQILLKQTYLWQTIDFLMNTFEFCVGPNRSAPPSFFGKKRNCTMVESW